MIKLCVQEHVVQIRLDDCLESSACLQISSSVEKKSVAFMKLGSRIVQWRSCGGSSAPFLKVPYLYYQYNT